MLNKLLRVGEGRMVKRLDAIASHVETLEDEIASLSDDELQAKTGEFKDRIAEGETLDERLAEEEPDVGAVDPLDEITAEERARTDWRAHDSDRDDEFEEDDEVGDRRAGRLIAPDAGSGIDTESDAVAEDAGIDGAGASAEEAAVHYISDSD